MYITPNPLSPAASKVENERRSQFFQLAEHLSEQLPTQELSIVDSTLIMNCFDEANYRYADFSLLLALTAGYALRNRNATSFFRRYRLTLYIGLVGYDWGLRSSVPAPATTFWNTAVLLSSAAGAEARKIYSPTVFIEPRSKARATKPQRSSKGVNSLLRFIGDAGRSLFLTEVLSHTFEGSCWRLKTKGGSGEVTALVLNNRFGVWEFMQMHGSKKRETVKREFLFNLFPRFEASEDMKSTYNCYPLVIHQSNWGAKLWYESHFFFFNLFGMLV